MSSTSEPSASAETKTVSLWGILVSLRKVATHGLPKSWRDSPPSGRTWWLAWNLGHSIEILLRAAIVCAIPIAAVLTGNAFLFSAQGTDLLLDYGVAFHRNSIWKSDAPSVAFLCLTLFLWALATFYCARQLMRVDFRMPSALSGAIPEAFGKWLCGSLPVLLGLACIVPIASEVASVLDQESYTNLLEIFKRPRPYFGLMLSALLIVEAAANRSLAPPWFGNALMALGLALTGLCLHTIMRSMQAEYESRHLEALLWVRPFLSYAFCLSGVVCLTYLSHSVTAQTLSSRGAIVLKFGTAVCLITAGLGGFSIAGVAFGDEIPEIYFKPLQAEFPDELGLILSLAVIALYIGMRCPRAFLPGRLFSTSIQWMRPGASAPNIGISNFVVLLGTIGLGFLMSYLITADPVAVGDSLGAVPIVLLAILILSIVATLLLVVIPKSLGFPSLVLLPIFALWVSANHVDNHDLPYVNPYPKETDQTIPRPTLNEHLQKWKEQRNLLSDEPIFIVAAAGGGLRAAAWTAFSLALLDDMTCDQFGRHVYAISGVSGGALGAAAYVAARREREEVALTKGIQCWDQDWDDVEMAGSLGLLDNFLSQDFISPAIASLLFPDLIQRFSIWKWLDRDRGWAIEHTWETRWRDAHNGNPPAINWFSQPFLSLYEGQGLYNLPLLFLNATSVEEGKRVIASPIRVQLDGFDLLAPDLVTDNLRLSSAVHNSARFSYVSPAGLVRKLTTAGKQQRESGKVPSENDFAPWGRIVDGGYFENSGAATARDLIEQIVELQSGGYSNIYAVVISNEPREKFMRACSWDRKSKKVLLRPIAPADKKAPWGNSSLPDITSPPEALLTTREARGDYAVRDLVRLLGCDHVYEVFLSKSAEVKKNTRGQISSVTTYTGWVTDPPLGWYLSAASQQTLKSALHDEFWGDRQPAQHELEKIAAKTLAIDRPRGSTKDMKTKRYEVLCGKIGLTNC